jgi:WD40 repeat protein
LAGGATGYISLIDTNTGEIMIEYTDQPGKVTSLLYLKDKEHFISGYDDGNVCLYNLKNNKAKIKISSGFLSVDILKLSNKGDLSKIIVGNKTNFKLKIIDLQYEGK